MGLLPGQWQEETVVAATESQRAPRALLVGQPRPRFSLGGLQPKTGAACPALRIPASSEGDGEAQTSAGLISASINASPGWCPC